MPSKRFLSDRSERNDSDPLQHKKRKDKQGDDQGIAESPPGKIQILAFAGQQVGDDPAANSDNDEDGNQAQDEHD